jgi:YD repeat-containing protein
MYNHIPATSNAFHLRHDITEEGFSAYGATLKIASGFNSFDKPQESQYLNYIPDWQSIQKPALEMINAQTNQVVRKYIFSDDPNCPHTGQFACPQLTLPANSNTKTLNLSFADIPEGDYYFKAYALHEPGNAYDEDEGCYSCPDYGKQYQFSVKLELRVPKSFKEEGYDREIGGARVSSIENYDFNDHLLYSKEYSYVLGDESPYSGKSSGVLIDKLVFANSINSGTDYYRINPSATISEYESFSESILHSPSENYIGYSRVEEKTIDAQNQTRGKKISIFCNRPNSYNTVMNLIGNFIFWNDPSTSNGYSPLETVRFPEYSSYDINGTISREEFFDSASEKIKEIIYDYNHDYFNLPLITRDDIIGKGLIQKFHNFYSFDETYHFYKYTDGSLSHLQTYKILNKSIPLITKTTKEYFKGIPLTTNVTYEYNDQYLLTLASAESSSGEVNEINNSYAHEKSNQYLIDKNIIGGPLQTIVTKTANGVTKTLSDIEYKYPTSQIEADTKTSGLPLPTSVISYGLQISGTSSSSKTELTYDKYDDKGNIVQYSEKGLKPTVIIWGYNKTQPIAKIEGAKYDDIKTIQQVLDAITASDTDANQGTATSEQSLLTALDNLRINSSFSNYTITTYTYDPLIGVTSITPPSGIREIYKYDTANRLQSVVDINGKILKEYQYNYKQ